MLGTNLRYIGNGGPQREGGEPKKRKKVKVRATMVGYLSHQKYLSCHSNNGCLLSTSVSGEWGEGYGGPGDL